MSSMLARLTPEAMECRSMETTSSMKPGRETAEFRLS